MTRDNSNNSPYKNREIDEKFEDIKGSLDRIESQTTKTNGRVGTLEERAGRQERWQAYVIGFCTCITIILLPVVFLIVQAYLNK